MTKLQCIKLWPLHLRGIMESCLENMMLELKMENALSIKNLNLYNQQRQLNQQAKNKKEEINQPRTVAVMRTQVQVLQIITQQMIIPKINKVVPKAFLENVLNQIKKKQISKYFKILLKRNSITRTLLLR